MNLKQLSGSLAAAALLGVGVLAGGVIGTGGASAQTTTQTPAATATAVPGSPTTPGTDNGTAPSQKGDMGGGMRGGRGHGGPGGDFGMKGGFGGNLTADGVTREISNTTKAIDTANADLAYAKGKMDTADVERWLASASSLLKSAQSSQTASQFGAASAYASAARELAQLAESAMANKLGAASLPSAANRPVRSDRDGRSSTTVTLTQAQASRMLAQAYNELTEAGTTVKAASNAAEASPYLTEAQNAYKTAYDAYQAGGYNDVAAPIRLADRLAHVAETVARASSAPANADTPVTVPAPTF